MSTQQHTTGTPAANCTPHNTPTANTPAINTPAANRTLPNTPATNLNTPAADPVSIPALPIASPTSIAANGHPSPLHAAVVEELRKELERLPTLQLRRDENNKRIVKHLLVLAPPKPRGRRLACGDLNHSHAGYSFVNGNS